MLVADKATQMLATDVIVVVSKSELHCRCLILVGDHFQLSQIIANTHHVNEIMQFYQ